MNRLLVNKLSSSSLLSSMFIPKRILKSSSSNSRGIAGASVGWFGSPCWQQEAQKQEEKKYFSSPAATAAYDQSVDVFPSLVIGPNRSIVPQGPFAEAQAQYLDPDPESVKTLGESLLRTDMGIVAHYYMDVELQGVLQAVKHSHPDLSHRIGIADSLKMGDHAVEMCKDHGVKAVACLGVDFMSESVSAILDKNGYGHVPVYRATAEAIGCSLAESAERESYRAWLQKATTHQQQPALHVVYINTSLETKAVSASLVPTITCTSSNVLQTILQASAQIGPQLKVLYGPDTYMGENLITLFDAVLSTWDDDRIRRDLHPSHTRETLHNLRANMDVYPSGNCVVHHMFGSEVVDAVKRNYDDCYVTAHLEVPGEMFEIAMQKSLNDQGVVGSTSNILNFISDKVQQEATAQKQRGVQEHKRLKFILGTEAGMVTSIVKSVQDILESTNNQSIEAEVIFPVSSDAVTGVEGAADASSADMKLVPGVAGGEGCSTAGGCATCPFMKMNDLDALQDIIDTVERTQQAGPSNASSKDELQLKSQLPPDRLRGKRINGIDATDLGSEPIVYMRELMANKQLSEGLVQKITQY